MISIVLLGFFHCAIWTFTKMIFCIFPQQRNLEGYVGFANLPNQVYRKSVKRGFEFTLMVVGKWKTFFICCHLFSIYACPLGWVNVGQLTAGLHVLQLQEYPKHEAVPHKLTSLISAFPKVLIPRWFLL